MILSEDQVYSRLDAFIGDWTLKAAAEQIGIPSPTLCRMRKRRIKPCGKALDAIGVERRGMGGKFPRPFRVRA
ncbi:MAG TPA: hypothetical protein VF389_11555 [Woeseiaceae bacterium]